MSVSRIAVPITELPPSVVVINEKLIEDTRATSRQDTLSLVDVARDRNYGVGLTYAY